MRWLLLVSISCFLNSCVYSQNAPFITPCYSYDTTCLISSAQRAVPYVAAGIPSLDMNPLDPLRVDHVQASQAGLDMDFSNTDVRGLRNCQVLDLKRMGSQTSLDIRCSVTLIGDYALSGKLLVMPISGQGKYKIKVRDIDVNVVLDIGERQWNGEKYWTIISWRHQADVKGGAHFQFQNLFNGDEQLARPVIDFANANWHEIFQEVAPPIVKEIVAHIVNETTKLFNNVPIDQLALD